MSGRDPLATLMRQWESVHPYNFLVIITLDQPLDPITLKASAEATLNEMFGITVDVPVRSGIDPQNDLAREFVDGESPLHIGWEEPARFSFTFRHSSFDGMGGVTFIKRTVLRARGASLAALQIDNTPEKLSLRHVGRSIADLLRMRKVHARSGKEGEAPHDLVRFIDFDPSLVGRLRAEAAPLKATINDAIATRLMSALRSLDPVDEGRRRQTALAIAVGMRDEEDPFPRKVAVSWFPIFSDGEPDLASIRNQTTREKKSRSWIRSRFEMLAASFLWPRVSLEKRDRYLARQYVLTGGLTNLRVAPLKSITSYQFAVATGPTLPMLVAAISAGERLSLSITWRAARFRVEEIDFIERALVR